MTEPKDYNIKKTNWKVTDNRFVAFIDILGFKDLVMRKTHEEIYDQLDKISIFKKIIENAAKNGDSLKESDAEIYSVSFSDSIVMFSKNDNVDNFRYFLIAVRYLFANAMKDGIPMKGSIAYGKISLNKSEQIYFGQPIIDAYFMEEDVNYMGLVAHNSIDEYIKNNEDNIKETRFHQYFFETKAPLKCGNLTHLNLNWFEKIPNSQTKMSKTQKTQSVIDCINNFKCTASGNARKYIDNTLDLFINSNSKFNFFD